MTDTTHSQEKEALEDAANRVLTLDSVALGRLAFTQKSDWLTAPDGSITGTAYTTAFVPSQDVLAWKAAWEAAQVQSAPAAPPDDSDPPEEPPPASATNAPDVSFTVTLSADGICAVKSTSSNVPDGTPGIVNFGNGIGKASYAQGNKNNATYRYPAQGANTVTLAFTLNGLIYTAACPGVTFDGTAHSYTSTPGTTVTQPEIPTSGSDAPSTGTSGGVYAQALAGLTLPVASAWSATRPAYTAQSTLTLADGTVLTCDTSKQVPDYVPYAGTWVYPYLKADGTRHPDLSLWCYADRVRVGNVWLDTADNYSGSVTIAINGAQVADWANIPFSAGCFTAALRKGLPQIAPSRTWNPTLIPNYGKIAGGYKSWAPQLAAADNGPTGRSITTPGNGMSNAGNQPSIGVLPGYHVPWLVDGGDANWAVSQQIEDHTGCWPIHYYDRITGLPALPAMPHCQDVVYGNYLGQEFTKGHVNPIKTKSNCLYVPNTAHQPGFGIVPFLATHAACDLEELLAWATYCCTYQNPVARGYTACNVNGSVRLVSWSMRSLTYAAALCPTDHPLYQLFQTVEATNCTRWTNAHVGEGAPSGNPFGLFIGCEALSYELYGMNFVGQAIWQQDYLTATLHQLVRMGRTEWQPLRDFVNICTKARMGTGGADGATGMYWTLATMGHWATRKPATTYTSAIATGDELVADWTAIRNAILEYGMAGAVPNGNYEADAPKPYADQQNLPLAQVNVGAGAGKPYGDNGSPTDYWAYPQPSFAALADCGDPSAWNLYKANIKPKDFSGEGEWNIEPEEVA